MIVYSRQVSLSRPRDTTLVIEDARHNAMVGLVGDSAPLDKERLEQDATEAFWSWHHNGFLMLKVDQSGWVSPPIRAQHRHMTLPMLGACPQKDIARRPEIEGVATMRLIESLCYWSRSTRFAMKYVMGS
jgi:hypothetical protein